MVVSRRRPSAPALLLAAVGFAAIFAIFADGQARGAERAPEVIDGSYIVVYENSVKDPGREAAADTNALGAEADLVYRHSIKGFAAELSDAQVEQLEADPDVDFVTPDYMAHASAFVPRASGEKFPPTGIRRINAARFQGGAMKVRQRSQTNVAVIDTGVKLWHPDINAVSGKDCVEPGTSAKDENGHGSHVAGTIGAVNDGAGKLQGVAPGTKIYAVRVLDAAGNGSFSQIICGIDWVTWAKNNGNLNVRVANMSLGGLGDPVAETCGQSTDPMHKAICRSTGKGVNYVVAAGNDGWDYDFVPNPNVPAAYPQVLTVTAMADSNGQPGGTGPDTSCSWVVADDTPAPFSNYVGHDSTTHASEHTVAGPGVCIKSTWMGMPNYNTISGTSMASPHVAGLVAQCIREVGHPAGPCASKKPHQVIDHMVNRSATYNNNNPGYGFAGDPLHSPAAGVDYGFLARSLQPQ